MPGRTKKSRRAQKLDNTKGVDKEITPAVILDRKQRAPYYKPRRHRKAA